MKKAFWIKLVLIPLTMILCCQTALAAGTTQFTETIVTPPQVAQADIYPVSITPHSDGSVDFFTMVFDGAGMPTLRRFHSTDGGKNWVEKECKWAEKVAKDYGKYEEHVVLTEDVFVAKDGTCYFGVGSWTDKEGHLIAAKPDGSYKEIPMPAWKTGHERITVRDVEIDGNGDFRFVYEPYVPNYFIEVIDGKTGAVKQRIEDLDELVALSGNIAVSDQIEYLSFYDLSTGKRLRDVRLPHATDEYGTGERALALGDDGAAYTMSQYGLERLVNGGSAFEMLMEGSRYYFEDKESSFTELKKQPGADVFYLMMQLDGKFMLCRYAAPETK